jgi:hypothetical protein
VGVRHEVACGEWTALWRGSAVASMTGFLTERHRSRQTLAAVADVPVRRGLANARAASGLRSGPALLIYLTGPITWDAAIQLVVRRPAE